ncbi:MAG: hypothetical protein ACLTDX_07420 [[Clostridium] innocuum]
MVRRPNLPCTIKDNLITFVKCNALLSLYAALFQKRASCTKGTTPEIPGATEKPNAGYATDT